MIRIPCGWIALLAAVSMTSGGCGPSRAEPVVIPADARIETAFRDELGGAFVLESIEMKIDGRMVGRHDAGAEHDTNLIDFPTVVLPAGDHEASVRAVYRGEGHGIFSYLKEYKFEVESTHEFRAPPLRTIALTAVCREQGGPTTELSDRPRIRWVAEAR